MSETIAVHVRYKSLYISVASPPPPPPKKKKQQQQQQREMTKFCVVYGTWRRQLIFHMSIGN